jgi:signal peptidase I
MLRWLGSSAVARWFAAGPHGSPRRVAKEIVGTTAALLLLHLFVVQVSVVRGSSMEPCLHDGDRLVVDRVTYSLAEVGRGDVVVLRYPRDPEVDFVKRVVGLPGESVRLCDGDLFVDGVRLEGFGCIRDHADFGPLQVPTGQYFVLGDNRPISCDSRDFGLVPGELLKGRVRARFWPLAAAAVF